MQRGGHRCSARRPQGGARYAFWRPAPCSALCTSTEQQPLPLPLRVALWDAKVCRDMQIHLACVCVRACVRASVRHLFGWVWVCTYAKVNAVDFYGGLNQYLMSRTTGGGVGATGLTLSRLPV